MQEREAFAAELIDRFGPLPDETKQLLEITAVKILCKRLGVAKVSAGPKGALLGVPRQDAPLDGAKLIAYVQKQPNSAEAAAGHEAGAGRRVGRCAGKAGRREEPAAGYERGCFRSG
jgi:transcription-repair coupling factor (superfamily II helicase)